jgi:hypothetical protein
MTCDRCGEEICKHGVCWCDDEHQGHCLDCVRRREDELDCEREAAFQRDVAGPLLGFEKP